MGGTSLSQEYWHGYRESSLPFKQATNGSYRPKFYGERKLKEKKEAVCYLCNMVTAISCLALPFITIYASAAGM